MLRMALIVGIVDTFHGLAVDADRLAGMDDGTLKRPHPLSLLQKALAAGVITAAGMFSAHHDIPLAAQTVLIIGTVLYLAL